jgi:hypothetical protein
LQFYTPNLPRKNKRPESLYLQGLQGIEKG